jgi:hypothetical protein
MVTPKKFRGRLGQRLGSRQSTVVPPMRSAGAQSTGRRAWGLFTTRLPPGRSASSCGGPSSCCRKCLRSGDQRQEVGKQITMRHTLRCPEDQGTTTANGGACVFSGSRPHPCQPLVVSQPESSIRACRAGPNREPPEIISTTLMLLKKFALNGVRTGATGPSGRITEGFSLRRLRSAKDPSVVLECEAIALPA